MAIGIIYMLSLNSLCKSLDENINKIKLHAIEMGICMIIKFHKKFIMDGFSIFVAALVIRAALIGLSPYADEGHYAAASYFHYLGYTQGLFSDGTFIPAFGGLELYSLLLSWIYFIPIEPFFLLRIADALFAACAGVMIYKYLYRATSWKLPAYLASLLVVVASNHPEFIEAGARNSIPGATFFLFCTLYLLAAQQKRKLFLSAICLAASVLLREQFLMFAGVVVIHVWYCHGFRAAAMLCALTAVFLAVSILTVAELRGGIGNITTMYDAYATHTNSDVHLSLIQKIDRGIEFGIMNLVLLSFCLPSIFLGFCAPLIDATLRSRQHVAIYFLGAGLMLAPLAEVLIKTPYAYHLAQALIGAGIFSCYGFHIGIETIKRIRISRPIIGAIFASLVFFIHGILLQSYLRTMIWSAEWSLHYAPVMVFGDWSSPVVNDSYYLRMAAIIRNNTDPGDRILSTSYNIYPLTRTIPLSRNTASLSSYRLRSKEANRDQKITDLIRDGRPILYLEEGAVLRSNGQKADVFSRDVKKRYKQSYSIGPDLQPYRSFFAKIHVVVEAPEKQD
jgi:hypothetical protein